MSIRLFILLMCRLIILMLLIKSKKIKGDIQFVESMREERFYQVGKTSTRDCVEMLNRFDSLNEQRE